MYWNTSSERPKPPSAQSQPVITRYSIPVITMYKTTMESSCRGIDSEGLQIRSIWRIYRPFPKRLSAVKEACGTLSETVVTTGRNGVKPVTRPPVQGNNNASTGNVNEPDKTDGLSAGKTNAPDLRINTLAETLLENIFKWTWLGDAITLRKINADFP